VGVSHRLPKIFRAPIYRAHRAVMFAMAQLSCYLTHCYSIAWDMCDLSVGFVPGQNPIKVSPIFIPFHFYPKNWHLRNAFSTGMLKHFSDVVRAPITAVHSSNNVFGDRLP